ncbi:SGNH hydrolase domain-containing protein [Bradyrhizobium betae]
MFRWTVGLDQIQTCLAAVAIAFLLAIASYVIIEQPARGFQWQRRLSVAKFIPASLAVVLMISGATAAVFKYKSNLTLSVTGNTDVWYPLARKSAVSAKGCKIVRSDVVEGGVPLTVWKPIQCQGALATGTVYVVGDSHASAYTTMVRQFALDTGTTVKVYSHEGCAFIPLDRPIAKHDSNCRKAHQEIAQYLRDTVKPHDIVFLPSLRLPRFGNQWGDVDGESKASSPAASNQAAVVAEAIQLLAPMTQFGVRVEFEAPKPLFRSPPFRCSDWFNRGNAVCAPGFSMSRDDLERLRTPVLAAMTELAAKNSKISIWDPFPVLCPDQTCTPFRDGKPLFFDADHLSGFGNDLLYGNFSKNTLALMGSTQSANAEPSK